MIDLMKSAELNNMTPIELYAWLKKYPGSGKRVICYCEECGKEREIRYQKYHDLCLQCANSTPERCKQNSMIRIEYFSHQENRDTMSEIKIEHFSHQENRDALSEVWTEEMRMNQSGITTEHFSHQENRDIRSESMKNSENHKKSVEKTIGGNDIVNHHYIYDFNDLTKYTIPVTRSEHTVIHHNLRRSGLEVPHINILKEE